MPTLTRTARSCNSYSQTNNSSRACARSSATFSSQSSFLTHLLALAHIELHKSAKSASIVKLQSLLDLALNTDAQGEDLLFREDVRVTMASSGLYEWLIKVLNESGVIGGEEGESDGVAVHAHEGRKKRRIRKNPCSLWMRSPSTKLSSFLSPSSFSRKTLPCYRLLFRFFHHLKQVEQSLCSMFLDHTLPAFHRLAPTHSAFSY